MRIDIPIIFLLGMNLIPLFGVIYFGWEVKTLLILYWLENVIAGIYNAIKMLTLKNAAGSKLFNTVFFLVHYGLFTFVHGIFVLSFSEETAGESVGDFPVTSELAQAISLDGALGLSILGLAVSHGISLLINFYGRGEYKTRELKKQMFAPYGRMVILHVVIIFGGLLVSISGNLIAALLVLIGLKIVMDIAAHRISHKQTRHVDEI